jgi:hypothetical protein
LPTVGKKQASREDAEKDRPLQVLPDHSWRKVKNFLTTQVGELTKWI